VLIRVIGSQNDNLQHALQALAKLVSGNEEAALTLLNVGGLTFLVELLTSLNESLQLQAVRCLTSLCSVPKIVSSFIPSVGINPGTYSTPMVVLIWFIQ
jgi:hypothetical protein